jgi:NADH-quinone oxidoreductase subunit H
MKRVTMGETGLGLIILFGVLIVAAALAGGLTWIERRLLALWQDRYGPNRAGPFGAFQIVADLLKIMSKEDWVPPFSDRITFVLAPTIVVVTLLTAFIVIPFTPVIVISRLDIGLLFLLGMLSLSVYSVVLAGWSSNNKYALIGGMRTVAQLLSYEVFMGLSLMGVVMMAESFNLVDIVNAQRRLWFVIPQILGFYIFTVAGIAVIHRLPFDLPEAESELVAGYHSEYSGMKFGLMFMGEYLGIILISAVIVVLFFGGWLGPGLTPILWFIIKFGFFVTLFMLLRGTLPRLRFDQLLVFSWKTLLPLSFLNIVLTGGIILAVSTGV